MIEPLYKQVVKEFLLSLTETSSAQVSPKKGILLTDHYYSDVLDISDCHLVMVDGGCKTAESVEDLKRLGYLQ